jgi:selenocysteine-specific elongation factor
MIIGTAGHIDHGKTSLVKAITGVDADRLKEEKARGITIDLGFAYWPQGDGSVLGFVDVPGHERFVHTMMAGAQGVDAVMLVIAADDGIMPQTREHLEILTLLGLRIGLVALTKIDRVSETRRHQVTADVQRFLADTGLDAAPVYPVSNVTGDGVETLKSALAALHQGHRRKTSRRLFRLAVDRSFILQGAGLVVTGTVLDGQARLGDEVTVSPLGIAARIRSIHAQNRASEIAQAGDRCALNLAGAGIDKDKVHRGSMILAPFAHAPTRRIDAEIRVSPGARKGLTPWMPVRLLHATSDLPAHIVLLADEIPKPGATAPIQIVTETPFAAYRLDRFILRDPSASITLGGGRFLDLRAPERKRRAPERLVTLRALSEADWQVALGEILEAAPVAVDVARFAQDNGEVLSAVLSECERVGAWLLRHGQTPYVIGPRPLKHLADLVQRSLAAFHLANPDLIGLGLERLRLQAVPRLAAPLFRLLLRKFVGEGWLALDGNWIRLSSHAVSMSLEDENLLHEIHPLIADRERFRPPRVRDIAQGLQEEEAVIRALLRRCGRAGELDEVAQDHFFLRGAIAEAVNIATGLEQELQGWFPASAFRDRLEAASGGTVGRKVAIQILEFFDRHGVTIRRGDLRRVNPHRRNLFEHAVETNLPEAAEAVSIPELGRESSLVGRPDFKSGWGREPVPGGFDSHSLPPNPSGDRSRASRSV